jgi:hypothetical protein
VNASLHSSSSMLGGGRCVCCEQQLVWLELLKGMQPYGAGTKAARARARSARTAGEQQARYWTPCPVQR